MDRRVAATDPPGGGARGQADEWLAGVAVAAGAAAQAPAELLGDYLALLADAATSGRRPREHELAAVRALGRQAAEHGVSAGRAVSLYLSAAWRLWRELPEVRRSSDAEVVRRAAEAMLHGIDEAVAELVDGYQLARRQLMRQEDALRRDFIDDLLRGDADVARMVQRAEPFGLDLGRPHQVALARRVDGGAVSDEDPVVLERVVVDRFGDRDVLVATSAGQLVVLVHAMGPRRGTTDVVHVVHQTLSRTGPRSSWRVTVGRPYPGAYGVARSYEEAREAHILAERLELDAEVLDARDLLIHRVVGRDRAAIADLVSTVLEPLRQARGGPGPLLDTLQAYFDAGEVATQTARRLHVSVRTVTYRLARITSLTGHDATDPEHRFTLQTAVLGARLLQWPAVELPAHGSAP